MNSGDLALGLLVGLLLGWTARSALARQVQRLHEEARDRLRREWTERGVALDHQGAISRDRLRRLLAIQRLAQRAAGELTHTGFDVYASSARRQLGEIQALATETVSEMPPSGETASSEPSPGGAARAPSPPTWRGGDGL